MKSYNHCQIESKWQKAWQQDQIYKTKDSSGKPSSYILDMFPYPSGDGLHVGHPRGYTATDIISRFKRMNGFNVLHPMGWDAFGLPAENFAIKNQIQPQQAVTANIKRFKKQIQMLGLDYDWSREINTTDPDYYRWTQWIFLQLYKAGLAYQSFEPINWCPSCQTGLANEDLEDGRCERCGSVVEKKPMRQWMLKITDYADKLLEGLDGLDWPESIKESQRHWIGRSRGAYIDFATTAKQHFVLLHGYRSSPETNFFPWLKRELESRGHSVEVPELPNSDSPDIDEQVEYVLNSCHLDSQTTLLGHSLGSVVALKVVEKINQPINQLILVAGFTRPRFKDKPRPKADRLNWSFDFDLIRSKITEAVILRDLNDPIVPEEETELLGQRLNTAVIDIKASKGHVTGQQEPEILKHCLGAVTVFTTRADTLFGASYLVLAPEHKAVSQLLNLKQVKNKTQLQRYIEKTQSRSEIERTNLNRAKTGVEVKGVKALNPASSEELPIFIADYVLDHYGTGAVMAVPAHDQRDFEFAEKFKLPIKQVIKPISKNKEALPFLDKGVLFKSGQFNGLSSQEAAKKIVKAVAGREVSTYKLKDWVFSRQRYWGEPIPLVHCKDCGVVAVPESQLPVKLPKVKSYQPTGTGESPLADIKSWVKTKCPECSGPAERETNTMPQWAGSCWYHLAYAMHRDLFKGDQGKTRWSDRSERKWLPVDIYVGGVEHATRHLIYARFWHRFLFDQKLLSTEEPFLKLKNQGMIHGEDNRKMSKRWGNVVNPDDVVRDVGADTLRVYEMFIGPFNQSAAWSTDSIMGVRKFLDKVWRLAESVKPGVRPTKADELILHQSIKRVTADIESFSFNTAISTLMILSNSFQKRETVSQKEYLVFLQLLAPFAPHITEELWSRYRRGSIHLSKWPSYDPEKLVSDTVTLAVQVNGKLRSEITVERDRSESGLIEQVLGLSAIRKYVPDKSKIKRQIYVPGRLINLVVG